MSDLDAILGALADPVRRGAVDLLRQRPRRAGELARELGLSSPAMSRQLRVLRLGGVVEEAPRGDDARVRTYRLRHEPFSELQEWLSQVESFWRAELDSFKAHAERTRARRRPLR